MPSTQRLAALILLFCDNYFRIKKKNEQKNYENTDTISLKISIFQPKMGFFLITSVITLHETELTFRII